MGIFNKLFGGESAAKEEKVLPWIPLVDKQQIDHIEKKSHDKLQLIFKHSTRCHISRMVMKTFEGAYDLTIDDADLYFLDLLSYRHVSNTIASKFQIMHESPQLLILKDGHIIASESHGAINSLRIKQFC